MLSLLCAGVLAAQPMAEVWPYQAKALPGGGTEYSFDLSAVKAKGPTVQAVANSGEDAAKKFLAGLPRDVKVVAKPGAGISLGGGRGTESTALVPAFSQVSDAPYASSDPLGRTPKARLRPALHPEEPKVLLTEEAVLWRVGRFEDGALATLLLDSDVLSAQLWNKVVEKAIARARNSQGDTAEGSLLLAARVLVALAGGEKSRLPKFVASNPPLQQVVDTELMAANAEPEMKLGWGYQNFSPELRLAAFRQRLFGRPLPTSRAGAAAGLVFLSILKSDPKLEASWNKLRARRDAIELPVEEPILKWRELAQNKPDDALDDLATFLDSMSRFAGPPLLAPSTTPARKFLVELEGEARRAAVDELLAAATDGRLISKETAGGSVGPVREFALAGLPAIEEPKDLSFDSTWRERRNAAFVALLGLHRDQRGEGNELPDGDDEPTDLRIRLHVPPDLSVEPSPVVYQRESVALDRLGAVFQAQGLCASTAVNPEGGRQPGAICSEAKRWASVMRGLATLDGGGNAADVAAARQLISQWRADPVLRSDVREAFVLPISAGLRRLHSFVVGVGRREMSAGFNTAPQLELKNGVADSFELTASEQRYLVPVLVTEGVWAGENTALMEKAKLRGLCDSAQHDPTEIEGALSAAVK